MYLFGSMNSVFMKGCVLYKVGQLLKVPAYINFNKQDGAMCIGIHYCI